MRILKVHPSDNITVALEDLKKGEKVTVNGSDIALTTDIPSKHKFADIEFKKGDSIYMYGVLVGKAIKDIRKGEVIATHNITHATSEIKGWTAEKADWIKPTLNRFATRTFEGFLREDGQVGTANYWIVIPLVFCENRNINILKNAFEENLGYARPEPYVKMVEKMVSQYNKGEEIPEDFDLSELSDESGSKLFENVTGIKFLNHTLGCGGTKDDAESLCRLLAGYITNPNVAGATVLSLGCQHAQIPILKKYLKKVSPNNNKPVLYFEQQEFGLEKKMLKSAIKDTFTGLIEANKIKRSPQSLSKLVIGVECGGSDGFSGISANPVIGRCSDLIVSLGGKSILSEFPELCGVEQNLVDRCESRGLAEKFIELSRNYEKWAESVGSGFDMNPSPGNIKDGLITDAIKSAGAAKKGGNSAITDVLDFGEYAKKAGLNLLCTPGNDVESTTGLAGSGANIILFSTGLGTPTGNPICPVIKISSNTKTAERMSDIIDFNTGDIIDRGKTIEDSADKLFEMIIETASGGYTPKAVQKGQDDFIPWKRGVSL